LEERAESFLQVVFDLRLRGEQLIERVIEPVLSDGAVRHAGQIFQTGGRIPMLGQRELAARLTQSIDHFDGDDVGRRDGLLLLRYVTRDNRVEFEELPEPARQPDSAEPPRVAPGDFAETHAHDIGIVGRGGGARVIVGKQTQFLHFAVTIVERDSALPAPLLRAVEFAEMGDDVLPRPRVGAHALDQREVDVLLAVFGPGVTPEKHPCLQRASMHAKAGPLQEGRFPLQRQNAVSTTQNTGLLRESRAKIVSIFDFVRKLG